MPKTGQAVSVDGHYFVAQSGVQMSSLGQKPKK